MADCAWAFHFVAKGTSGPLAQGITQGDKAAEKTEGKVQDAYLEPFFVYAFELQGEMSGKTASFVNLPGWDAEGRRPGCQHNHQFENGVVAHCGVMNGDDGRSHSPGELLGVIFP